MSGLWLYVAFGLGGLAMGLPFAWLLGKLSEDNDRG